MPKKYKLLLSKAPQAKQAKGPLVDIEDLLKPFRAYTVKQIEVWVSGAIEAGQVVKLIVSAKAEGGIKLTLVPKSGSSDRVDENADGSSAKQC